MQPVQSLKGEPESLTGFYSRVRAYTEKLCEPLEIEDYIPQPVIDVSPPKWNIAHTTWFFEEMILKKLMPGYKVFDENFGFLFNSYYNSIGERTARDHRGSLSRPTVKRVFEYRKYVDERMRGLLSNSPPYEGGVSASFADGVVLANPDTQEVDLTSEAGEERTTPSAPRKWERPPLLRKEGNPVNDLVILGLNHEQQHQELFLTDLKYTFSVNPLFPAYRTDLTPELTIETESNGFLELEGGVYEVGYAGGGFCFDNELARHKVYIDDFEIASKLVTNQEFLEFVNDGGYRDHRLWHSEGWDWVNQNAISSPLYWYKIDGRSGRNASVNERADSGEWHQFTLGGLQKLNLDAPVCHVSFYEASAFAEWRGLRLPTEFEWEAANENFNWGLRWEWTNSAYLPYPGFKKGEGAVGEYNGKFMINQMVLRGASVATPEGHSRPTYRNFFHPHLRWQFTGIRLAR